LLHSRQSPSNRALSSLTLAGHNRAALARSACKRIRWDEDSKRSKISVNGMRLIHFLSRCFTNATCHLQSAPQSICADLISRPGVSWHRKAKEASNKPVVYNSFPFLSLPLANAHPMRNTTIIMYIKFSILLCPSNNTLEASQ